MPLLFLLVIIIGLPLLEIAIFIQVGEAIGVAATLAAVVLGTIVGVAVVRAQGIGVFNRLRQQVDSGQPPERELFDAACLLLAGFFVLIPGFFTDTLGVLLMLPPVRAFLMRHVAAHARSRGHAHGQTRSYRTREGVVIEGEYEEVDGEEQPREPEKKDGPDQGPRRLP